MSAKQVSMPYVRKTPFQLKTLFTLSERPQAQGGGASDGVAITSYGQGQVTGAMYTVPAHAELNLNFSFHLQCVTPADIANMNTLIRGLLDASHQHLYDDLQKTDISGGASFFGFFSAGVSASYSETKHTMDSWGLSEVNQQAIVNAMMALVQRTSDFGFTGTVYNRDYDYSVSGNVFGIVMDATIAQGAQSNQVRFLAPNPRFQSNDGNTLPTVGSFY
jgi:hypothetical protein